jgi:dTDP-glucose 4,6-dehydratase
LNLLVTGAAGFIGSHFVRLVQRERPTWNIIIVDALTYSGNESTMVDLLSAGARFFHARIEDRSAIAQIIEENAVTHMVNFAAESHNDRSLQGSSFLTSNAFGVEVLAHLTKEYKLERFLQVSTDEVYGSIAEGQFYESTSIAPNTPYSASKAAGEMVCRAHWKAFQTPIVVTRGGNTYGPYQYPEKLIPFFTVRLLLGKKVPLYGDGSQIREWIHVEDHAAGILTALEHGQLGEAYNVGDDNERENRETVRLLLTATGQDESLVKSIEDPRKGAHDARYSMNTAKLRSLGWEPKIPFDRGLTETVEWYKANTSWWSELLDNASYQDFIRQFYGKSLGADL